jgi:hypothetical protein
MGTAKGSKKCRVSAPKNQNAAFRRPGRTISFLHRDVNKTAAFASAANRLRGLQNLNGFHCKNAT